MQHDLSLCHRVARCAHAYLFERVAMARQARLERASRRKTVHVCEYTWVDSCATTHTRQCTIHHTTAAHATGKPPSQSQLSPATLTIHLAAPPAVVPPPQEPERAEAAGAGLRGRVRLPRRLFEAVAVPAVASLPIHHLVGGGLVACGLALIA